MATRRNSESVYDPPLQFESSSVVVDNNADLFTEKTLLSVERLLTNFFINFVDNCAR